MSPHKHSCDVRMSFDNTLYGHRMDAEMIPLSIMGVMPQCSAIDDGKNGCRDDHDLR